MAKLNIYYLIDETECLMTIRQSELLSDNMEDLVTLGRFVSFSDKAEGRMAKLNIYYH